MAASRRRRSRGVGLVEFALVLPIALFVVFGLADFGRAIQINSTVAEASRQGARQAAANDSETPASAFGTPSGSCSGTQFVYSASIGTGCLSDTAILNTVKAVLKDAVPASQVNVSPGTDPPTCGTGSGANAKPAQGWALVCISQPSSGAVPNGAPATCSSVWSQATYPSAGNLGGRQNEFTTHTYQGCYMIQVTVLVTYAPFTPMVAPLAGTSITLRSTTSTIAEY